MDEQKVKNFKEIKVEKQKRIKQFCKLFPRRNILSDPWGTPTEHQDKLKYLKLYELASYISTLNWILGISKKEIEKEIEAIQNNPKIIKYLKDIKGNKIRRSAKEINLKINKVIEDIASNYKLLTEKIEKAKLNPSLITDGDSLIFEYEERKLRSNLLGQLKALYWFLGKNEKGFEKGIKPLVIDKFDIASAFEDF